MQAGHSQYRFKVECVNLKGNLKGETLDLLKESRIEEDLGDGCIEA